MLKLVSLVAGMRAKLASKTPASSRLSSSRKPQFDARAAMAILPPNCIASRKDRHMHDVAARVHWHEPTGGKRAGFGKWGRVKTPYDLFMESEGIPCFRDIGISQVRNLPLQPWKRTGGRGTYIQLHGTETKWGCYLVEVPGRGALNAEKHLFEKIFFVVEGRGSTEVWLEGDKKRHTFE